jgi:hypothetical protein
MHTFFSPNSISTIGFPSMNKSVLVSAILCQDIFLIVWGLAFGVGIYHYQISFVCCLLFVVCCLLFVVCCLLFIVYCLLFIVYCLWFGFAQSSQRSKDAKKIRNKKLKIRK